MRSADDFEAAAQRRLAPLAPALDLGAFRAVWLLHEAATAARRQMAAAALTGPGLTWTQFEVLWHLWLFGPEQHRALADELGISKGSVTAVTTALEGRGLVGRAQDGDDRRLVTFALTRNGRAAMRRLFPAVNRAEAAFSGVLQPREKAELARLLGRLVSSARGAP